MSVKKICIAIHGLSHAGAERVAVAWANYLTRHGHDVFMLIYAGGDDSYVLDKRVRIVSIATTQEAFFAMPVWKRLWEIRKIIRREAPQTLISFLPRMQLNMLLATIGLRIERIETIRNNPWVDKDVGKRRFLWNLCFRRADKIILQTTEQSEYFDLVTRKKCTVISNPIAKEFISGRKEYSEKVQRFVAVGRLSAQKNYAVMIQAFALAVADDPNYTLDIYGMGSSEAMDSIRSLIAQLRLADRVRLCGWTGNISELLQQYDAFLMSSDYEGMPNALAEAMVSGLVCVSTNCRTGPKDMIEHGKNGYLIPVGDIDAYAEGIKTVLKMDVCECARMGAAARERMLEMCSVENTLARLKTLVEAE